MNKKIIWVLTLILLVGSVSAFNFDNKITYKDNDLKVEFSNSIGLFGVGISTSKIGEATLKSHNSVDEVLHFGFGKEEVVMYYDFNWILEGKENLGEVTFIDLNSGKELDKDYSFVYWNGIEWKPFKGRDIPKGVSRIGIKTYIDKGEYIDGIWDIAGKKVNKHASWMGDLYSGLMVYYSMDETSGTTIFDNATKEYNGTAVNTPNLNIPGKIGQGTSFNTAENEYVSMTTFPRPTEELTVSFWVSYDELTTNYAAVGMKDAAAGSAENTFFTGIEGGTTNEYSLVTIGASDKILRSAGLNASFWHHIVVTFTEGNLSSYQNGILVDSIDTGAGTLDSGTGLDAYVCDLKRYSQKLD